VKQSLALPFRLLRDEPRLVARFAIGSLGRSALTAGTILLIRDFLGGALGARSAAHATAPTAGAGLWTVVLLLFVAFLGAALLTYDTRVTEQRIVKVIELGTMERLIRQLLGLSVGFFDRRTHGDLIQSVRQDVTHLRTVTVAIANLVLEAVQAAGLMVAAIVLSPSLALWAFILVPLAAAPIFFVARQTLARAFGVRRKGVVLFDVILQLLHGIRIIKIYQGEGIEADRTVSRARSYFDEVIAMERVRALAGVVLATLGGLSFIAVIVVGGLQVMHGTLGWPELLAFLMAVRAAHGPLNNVNTNYLEIQRYGAAVEQLDALLHERPEIDDRQEARRLTSGPRVIAAENLRFAIGGTVVLDGVSFSVRAGETLGIAGPSGAGKTTLLNLVARFYDPAAGAVRFDGVDLRDLRLRDVQSRIAIVTQDPFLFSTTIRENIRCGRPTASDGEIEDAARAAGIHDEIMAMPDGYETVVGHGGRTLSRGEAQRVNIARAILKNAEILLLDEATSSLDSYSEALVQRAIDRLSRGRLVLSVAHRLSTLRHASRILVLEGGRPVGLGTTAELLAGCVTFQRLWNAQSPGAGPLPMPDSDALLVPADAAAGVHA
jgi:ABC-type multidrug transport system fused ATPase/permease subunit